METETNSLQSTEAIAPEFDAAHPRHLPRSALGSVLEDTIATENTRVLQGWLVDSESADHRWLGDHS